MLFVPASAAFRSKVKHNNIGLAVTERIGSSPNSNGEFSNGPLQVSEWIRRKSGFIIVNWALVIGMSDWFATKIVALTGSFIFIMLF